MFTQDEGGFRSSTVENGPYKELYFVGIVDIFQEYTIKKQLEHSYKVKKYDTPVFIVLCFLLIFVTGSNIEC